MKTREGKKDSSEGGKLFERYRANPANLSPFYSAPESKEGGSTDSSALFPLLCLTAHSTPVY